MSFKSRTAKLVGTWTIKSNEFSTEKVTTTTVTNSVNNDQLTTVVTESSSTTQTDGNWTTTDVSRTEADYTYKTLNSDASAFVSASVTQDLTGTETVTGVADFQITFNEDNTYELKRTTSAGTYTFKGTGSYKDADGISSTFEEYMGISDTSYSYPASSSDDTEIGTWYWAEESDQSKLYLNAGMLSGQVLKITKEELVFESKYGKMEDGATTGDTPSSTTSNTSVVTTTLSTHSNTDLSASDEGEVTTVTTVVETTTTGQMIFSKVN